MIKLRMPDGISFLITGPGDVSLKGFADTYQIALQDRTTIWIENDEGGSRHINPFQILYFEEVDE